MNTSLKRLKEDFESIGIKKGDVVFVHSSLSSMGNVEGGANTVIEALLSVLGDEGTLLFPAFTYRTSVVDKYFSYHDTPSCVGKISETFRKLDGVVRSFHPTHSVTAKGKYAIELTKDHYLDDTPVGENSPLRKLPKYNGKILMLGCSFASITFVHGMEEIASVPYVLKEAQEYTMIDKDGNKILKSIKGHNFVREEGILYQRYDRVFDVLEKNEYTYGDIHGAKCVIIDTVALEKRVVKKMKEEPTYFIDDVNGILNKN